jgi:hypothetical protein
MDERVTGLPDDAYPGDEQEFDEVFEMAALNPGTFFVPSEPSSSSVPPSNNATIPTGKVTCSIPLSVSISILSCEAPIGIYD